MPLCACRYGAISCKFPAVWVSLWKPSTCSESTCWPLSTCRASQGTSLPRSSTSKPSFVTPWWIKFQRFQGPPVSSLSTAGYTWELLTAEQIFTFTSYISPALLSAGSGSPMENAIIAAARIHKFLSLRTPKVVYGYPKSQLHRGQVSELIRAIKKPPSRFSGKQSCKCLHLGESSSVVTLASPTSSA